MPRGQPCPRCRGKRGIGEEMLDWPHWGSQPQRVPGFGPAHLASQREAEVVYSQRFSPHREVCRRRSRSPHAPQQASSGLPLPKGERIVSLPAKTPFSIRFIYMTSSPAGAGSQSTWETKKTPRLFFGAEKLGAKSRGLKSTWVRKKTPTKTTTGKKPNKKISFHPSFIHQACLERRPLASPLRLSPRESWASKFAEAEGGRHRSIGEFNGIRSV